MYMYVRLDFVYVVYVQFQAISHHSTHDLGC